jgi:hypothetical protein
VAHNNPTVDPALKARALALAADVGTTEAARQTGVPRGTLASWRSREGLVERPSGVSPGEWANAKRTAAENAWQASQEALDEIRRVLAGPKNQGVQGLAITYGVLLDKATQLETAAQLAEAHQVRLTRDQTELVAQVIMVLFEGLGVQFGPLQAAPPPTAKAIRQALAALLRQAEQGAVMAVPPALVPAAQDELRAALGCGSTCSASKHSTGQNPHRTGRLDADQPAELVRLPFQLPESTDSTPVDAQAERTDPADRHNTPELQAGGSHPGGGWPTRAVSGRLPETDLVEVVSGEILCDVDLKERL